MWLSQKGTWERVIASDEAEAWSNPRPPAYEARALGLAQKPRRWAPLTRDTRKDIKRV